MISPKVLQLIALAEELSNKMEEKTVIKDEPADKVNHNVKFEAQREFGRQFHRKLRAILGELAGDLFTLKERKFDPNMWRLASKVKGHLEGILLSVKESRPHEAAWKLVDYVMDKSTGNIINNLDFLAQQHLEATKPEGHFTSTMRHAEVNSFKHLKELAEELRNYMEQNPALPVPISSPPPPRENPAAQSPAALVGPDVPTKG